MSAIPLKRGVELYIGLIQPIVVGARNRHRIIEADDLAVSQGGGRIEHGPFDSHIVETIEPTLGSHRGPLVSLGRRFHRAPGMKMIQRGNDHAFSLRDLPIRGIHMGDDPHVVFHDVAITIDDSSCELTGH